MDNHLFLTAKAFEGLDKRGLFDNPIYVERLEKELEIIKSGNLADFFLNTAFICMKMKSKGIFADRGMVNGVQVRNIIAGYEPVYDDPPPPDVPPQWR